MRNFKNIIKKSSFKTISVVLTLALLLQTVSVAVTAISESGLIIDEMVSIDDSLETMPSIVGEVESKRDQHTKVYELSDGSFYEVISNDPIHENIDGKWEEPANNIDIPESVDEVTSYCSELIDSISEEQNSSNISTFSYTADENEPHILNDVYIIRKTAKTVSSTNELNTSSRLLVKIDDSLLSLSKPNQIIVNETLNIECVTPQSTNGDEAVLSIQGISQKWFVNDKKLMVYNSNGGTDNVMGGILNLISGTLDSSAIGNTDFTCEFDITEICHKWSKGLVENNGLCISLSGQMPKTNIGDCFITRRYIVVDSYDPDFTYHSIDMGYAGQVLVNDFTNTVTILRNEMYYPTGDMPINLYRYFDFSKSYSDPNPAGIGSHWNYESPIKAETSERIAWSAFDGQTIRFEPSETDSTKWYPKNSQEYELNISAANIIDGSYGGVTIRTLDGLAYTFGTAGKITRIDDSNGNYINVSYNNETTQDYITIIENNSGLKYQFNYQEKEYVLNGSPISINTLVSIEYRDAQNAIIKIDDTEIKLLYDYTILPNSKIALSKVTYPTSATEPDMIVEYLYDSNGRLTGIIDVDKRKLEIGYTYLLDDTDPTTSKDNYPSASCFKELVLNKSYTEDMSDDEQYLEIPKSLLKIDRRNTYHRTFTNELDEEENLHYTREFDLLYYTNNDEKDFYADYSWENGQRYISQIVSPEYEPSNCLMTADFEPSEFGNEIDIFWSGSGLDKSQNAGTGSLSGEGVRYATLNGSINDIRYLCQEVYPEDFDISANAGDIFVIGGYAKAVASASNDTQFFGIEVYDVSTDDILSEDKLLYRLEFDPTMDDQIQFRLGAFKLNEDVEKFFYRLVYSYQTGDASFDDVLFYKSSENVDFFAAPVSGSTNDDTEPTITPSNPSNPTDEEDSVGSNEIYNTVEFTDDNNITTLFDYSKDTGFLAQKRVETDGTLSNTGAYIPSYIVDQYSYDAMGALTEVKRVVEVIDPEGSPSEKTTIENITNYEYEYGRISSVIHNNMSYYYNYNSYGDLENITVDLNSTEQIPLISYDYTDDTRREINKITYSNGKVLGYSYDDNGRITAISDCSGTPSKTLFSYSYDTTENTAENITEIKDHTTRRVLRRSDNLYQIYELAGNSDSLDDAELIYSKLISKNDSGDINETISVLSINYLKTTNTPIYNSESNSTTYSSITNMNIGYSIEIDTQAACDYFGRITNSSVTVKEQDVQNSDDYIIKHSIENERTYLKDADGTSTSSLLETFSTTIRDEEAVSTDKEIFDLSCIYSYDKAGRITHIFYKYNNHREDDNNNDENENKIVLKYYYEYDDAGQLLKEADYFDQTYKEYSYDSNGNISRKIVYSASDTYIDETDGKVYLKKVIVPGTEPDMPPKEVNPTPINDIQYAYYEDYNDVLKRYGGKDITPDEFGNPDKYHRINGTKKDTFILGWEGNLLQTVRPEGDDSLYEYKYDDEGRRIQKILYYDYDPNNPANKKPEMIMDYIWDDNKIMGYRVVLPSDTTSITIDAAILYDELDDPVGLKYCTTGTVDGENSSNLSNEDVFWFIKDGQGNVMALYSEITNYRIGCDYNSEGKLEINDTKKIADELNQRIEEADDFQSGLLIALSASLAVSFSTMISTDATQSTNNSSIMDIETGLYYCQNKYYSPEYGRFINVGNIEEIVDDLENPFNSNPFVYCNNDPINHREASMKSKSSSTAVGIQAELSKSIFSFSDSVGIEFVYDPVKDELFAYYYSDAKTNIDYTSKAIEHIKNVLGSIPFTAATSLNGLASNFKINNSLSLSYFSVQHDKNFVWPNSYQNMARVKSNKTNGYRGYMVYGNRYQSKGICFYPTTNIGFAFNDLTVNYTKLEVNFPELKDYLAANRNNIISITK